MVDRIDSLRQEAEAAIAAASSLEELEEARVRALGRKAELVSILRGIAELPPDRRGPVGRAGNQARQALEELVERRRGELEAAELDRRLSTEAADMSLPGSPSEAAGSLHLLTTTRREIEDVFCGLGFRVVEGPEVETVHYNFDALNHLPTHPARLWSDTFYLSAEDDILDPGTLLLRTHTSPMQVRVMEQTDPPLQVVVPGRVYRRDSDATHTPQFHQVEGLVVDRDTTLTDLAGTLEAFASSIFGGHRHVRLRGHFFPFTEPSVEVDVDCYLCEGTGALDSGDRCGLCKGSGWIEILGAGMVDPNVLRAVGRPEYDPERVQGFAFGMGIERIAMLKHRIPDLRLHYDNDVRYLEQFG